MSYNHNTLIPRPFLKWVGGKGQLLPVLGALLAEAGTLKGYHEPFLGGGALFWKLAREQRLPSRVHLSDSNANLIEAYMAVRDNLHDVMEILRAHKEKHSHDYFYQVRARCFSSIPERAARLIYLNKTCFNGLYRENRKGSFNSPIGSYKNPTICDTANLMACASSLKGCSLASCGFENVLENSKKGDLVYFDPPYDPLSSTSSFTSYSKDSFGKESHERLACVFEELDSKQVKVMLSNSNTELIAHLYKNYRIQKIPARRAVNCVGISRGQITELLISNF